VDKKKFLKRLGAHIAKVRRQRGYSQDRVYLEGGFSRGTLSKIENGQVSTEVYTLARIAEVIDVPLKKLLEFDSD
jgi:transcriptional regulator with XRE-family HTH domain